LEAPRAQRLALGAVVLLILPAVAGCGAGGPTPTGPGDSTASVALSVTLAPAIDQGVTIDRVSVAIRSVTYADSMDLAIAGDSASGVFTQVPVGSYVLSAYLFDVGTIVATGSGSAEVRAGQTSYATIAIGLVGALDIDITWQDGASRSVLDFNGTGTAVTVPHAPDLNLTGPFTLEAWVLARDYQYPGHQYDVFPHNVIIDKRDDIGFGRGYGLSLASGYPSVSVAISENMDVGATSATPVELNRYHHIAGTWDGDSLRIFLDGACTGRLHVPAIHVVGSGDLVMGARYSHNQYWWDGAFAGVRVSEICRYVSSFEPPLVLTVDQHTVALWPFDTGSGAAALDISGQGHHGAIQNGGWTPWTRPGG